MNTREEIEQKLRLPWHITCNIACRAMVAGTDFERMTERMLSEGLAITNNAYKQTAIMTRENRRADFKAKQAARG